MDNEYRIKIEEGSLKCHHQRHGTFNLYQSSNDWIKGAILRFTDIKIERWTIGDVKGIRVSNGRVRDMWFRKE